MKERKNWTEADRKWNVSQRKPEGGREDRKEGLTKNSEKTQENDGQSAHAQPQDLLLLHQLAVVAGKSGRAVADVALDRVSVDADAAVVARVVETLVAIDATLAVRGDPLTSRAPALV